jgi:integrase
LPSVWTAQREGDLLALSWASYDGTHIRLKQSKTGARMIIPVGAPLKAALDATRKQSPLILVNSRGQAWSGHAFQAAFGTAAGKAGIAGLTFHDLRGSAITRLALAGCSELEIATLSGYSLRDVRSVLEKFYLHRDTLAVKRGCGRELSKMTATDTRCRYARPPANGNVRHFSIVRCVT